MLRKDFRVQNQSPSAPPSSSYMTKISTETQLSHVRSDLTQRTSHTDREKALPWCVQQEMPQPAERRHPHQFIHSDTAHYVCCYLFSTTASLHGGGGEQTQLEGAQPHLRKARTLLLCLLASESAVLILEAKCMT